MNLRIAIIYSLILVCVGNPGHPLDNTHEQSLLGHMTDIQSWVDEKGVIVTKEDINIVMDLSADPTPIVTLRKKLKNQRFQQQNVYVKYLSLARCKLTQVPRDFHLAEGLGKDLVKTVEYITFYGNEFMDWSAPGEQYDIQFNATDIREMTSLGFQKRDTDAVWSVGLKESIFPRLRELDIRKCHIKILSGGIFSGMPNLEALYLAENNIVYIDTEAFVGLSSLIHLDISRNNPFDENGPTTLDINSFEAFTSMENLASLDLSLTKLTQRHTTMFTNFGKKLVRLSLFDCGLTNLGAEVFKSTSLRILDLTRNNGILSNSRALEGLQDTLEVIYARDVGLRSLSMFQDFENLKILDVSANEITAFRRSMVENWKKLEILNLDNNRIPVWEPPVISVMPNLKLFQVRDNNMNVITNDLINDMKNLEYLSMSGNFIVCNCYSREFIDLAAINELSHDDQLLGVETLEKKASVLDFHTGYIDFNANIIRRHPVATNHSHLTEEHRRYNASFVLMDYVPLGYSCMKLPESSSAPFQDIGGCSRGIHNELDVLVTKSTYTLITLTIVPALFIILILSFVFRRNLRYFMITMRNSAMLSMISKNDVLNDGAIFHYDVFVSYCNEDRNWVLDHLLPRLETDCMVSACLHERDFQVGHSILENIVSCMDRSRSIMLILSQKFLLSKWCQFEMHLAQHRLLETRREDLTLILLEDIPRRMRPNTLHYLMLTKTYIVWPQDENEKELFWKRLKKSLVAIKMRPNSVEGVSLA